MLNNELQTGMKIEPIHLNTLGSQINVKAWNTVIKKSIEAKGY